MKNLLLPGLFLLGPALQSCAPKSNAAEEAVGLKPETEAAAPVAGQDDSASKTFAAAPSEASAVEAAPAAQSAAASQPVAPVEAAAAKAAPEPAPPQAPAPPAPPSHEPWDALLRQHVTADGKVGYQALLAEMSRLQAYLDALAAQLPDQSWSRNERLAYWINAYNAFTVKLILDNYPLASILDLHGGKAWDVAWIELGGKIHSLNQIEHEIIRKQFREPRIHFAVNCAAASCPPLLNRAWTAANLEANLARQAKSFINDPKYNQLGADAAQLSKIFEWYAEDFGAIIPYLNQYAASPIKPGAELSFLEYDWRLNSK